MKKASINIVIADHDPQSGKRLFDTLSRRGFNTQIVSSSNHLLEAIAAARREQAYDLVFLDAALDAAPEGFLSLSVKLQEMLPGIKIIVLLETLASYAEKETKTNGKTHFLLKPITDEHAVMHLVESCLDLTPSNSGLALARNYSEYVTAQPGLKDLLQKLTNLVVKNLGYEICTVILRRRNDPRALEMAAMRGLNMEHLREFCLKVGEGITGNVIETGQFRAVPNIFADKDYRDPGFTLKENLCSMLSIPLRHHDSILGALNIYTGAGYSHHFKPDEINLLTILADWTAFALQNAAKHETKEKEQTRLIEEIIRETQSSDSLEKMIKAILPKSIALVGGDSGYIAFVNFERMRFHPVIGHNRKIENVRKFKIGSKHEGIAGHVARHGKAEIIDALHDDPRYKIKIDSRIQSKVIVPLKYQKQVVGLLSVDSNKRTAFNDDDKRILEVLASHLALIFQKQKFDQAYRKLGDTFRASQDLHEIYAAIIKCGSEIIGAKAVALWEKDAAGDFIICDWAGLAKQRVLAVKIPAREGIISEVIAKRDAVIIKDVKKNARYCHPELIADTPFKWLLCAPIFFGNEVFGVIDIYSRRPHGFFEQEIDYIKALANQVGVVIQNARLIDHFNRIGQANTSSQGITEILESIAQSALEVLYAEPVTLFQFDQASNRLVAPPICAGKLLEERDYVESFVFSGHSFAELIIKRGESIYIENDIDGHELMIAAKQDASTGMPKQRFHEREKIKSLAALVLKLGEETVGLMFLNYRTPQNFSPIEKKIMEAFASQAAIAIRNSRLVVQFRNILEKIPDPIIVTENQNTNGDAVWKIVFANQVAHEMFGHDWASRELEGKDAREHFGEQTHRLTEALQEGSGEVSDFETSFLHKNGTPIPISLSTSILQKDSANRIVRTIGIAKDLTSRKELEKSKITIDKLQLKLADIGHEFRAPLHIIISQIGGLKYHLQKNYQEDPLVTKTAKIVEEEAHRAARQMKNTLWSTAQSLEALGVNFEKGFIGDTVMLCVERFLETANKRGIKIIVYDSVKKLPGIYYDKSQMEQVFTNLIDNAVKYSFFNQNLEIRGRETGRHVEIAIVDRGLGIPEDQHERIFQGFSRSEILDTTRYIPGTGLGLMIAKEIVERHKGQIKFKSVPFFKDPHRLKLYEGYETTFFVVLPHHPKEV